MAASSSTGPRAVEAAAYGPSSINDLGPPLALFAQADEAFAYGPNGIHELGPLLAPVARVKDFKIYHLDTRAEILETGRTRHHKQCFLT